MENNWQYYEYEKVLDVLNKNKTKSFVQRILTPDEFPRIKHSDGFATHRMAWANTDGGKAIVYPTILLGSKGELKDYGSDALSHVINTDNFIEFNSPKEAEWFTKNYKSAWGGKKNNMPE